MIRHFLYTVYSMIRQTVVYTVYSMIRQTVVYTVYNIIRQTDVYTSVREAGKPVLLQIMKIVIILLFY